MQNEARLERETRDCARSRHRVKRRSVREEHVSDYPSPEKRSLSENRYPFRSIDAREEISSQGGVFVSTLQVDVVTR